MEPTHSYVTIPQIDSLGKGAKLPQEAWLLLVEKADTVGMGWQFVDLVPL